MPLARPAPPARILITTWLRDVDGLLGCQPTYTLGADYVTAVQRAGGLPLLAPHLTTDTARVLLDQADGLILSGGPDIDPRAYGEEDQGACWGIDRGADRTEMALAREAVRRGIPTLAICRGLQILNVALGGSLHQDISGASGHLPLEGPPERLLSARHVVRIASDSRLAAVYGAGRHVVNTIHHQAVKTLGDGLRVTARDESGIVEALELADGRPILAVQWHPERHGDDRLFAQLVSDAASRAHRRGGTALAA